MLKFLVLFLGMLLIGCQTTKEPEALKSCEEVMDNIALTEGKSGKQPAYAGAIDELSALFVFAKPMDAEDLKSATTLQAKAYVIMSNTHTKLSVMAGNEDFKKYSECQADQATVATIFETKHDTIIDNGSF